MYFILNRILFYLLALLNFLLVPAFICAQIPEIDLRNSNFEITKTVKLTGKWGFYWNKLLTPQQALTDTGFSLIEVPAPWEGQTVKQFSDPLPAYGAATYIVKVRLPPTHDIKGFLVPLIWTSHKLWINDSLVSQSGNPGLTPETTISKMTHDLIAIPGNITELTIVVQIADFNLALGGLAESPIIAPYTELQESLEITNIYNLSVIGALLILAIYYILIYFFRRKERSKLWFAFICLVVVVRFADFGEHDLYEYLNRFVSWYTFDVQVKTYYVATLLLGPLGLYYLHSLFPKEFHPQAGNISISIISICVLIAIWLPTPQFTLVINIVQLILFACVLYALWGIALAIYHKREDAGTILIGIGGMALTGLHDVLHLAGIYIITEQELLTQGFLFFLFVQFVLLSGRYAQAFTSVEDLSENLEKKVIERTIELQNANEEILARNQALYLANQEIEAQKNDISAKNKDITDSITYARRIQFSILPPEDAFTHFFSKSFLIYRPKDIVSGDFYWLQQHQDYLYFCIADCTGHGVPGAFMSVLGLNLLNEILLREANYNLHPGKFLTRLNRSVRAALGQEQKRDQMALDGMDMALCRYHLKHQTLEYAGANRALWRLSRRNGITELFEQPPDKRSIGGTSALPSDDGNPETLDFKTTAITIHTGEILILFSDGIVDQFGGTQKRKFGSKNLRELLLKSANDSFVEMENNIRNTLLDWQQKTPQTDDQTLLAIRF
jgi:serine phosphatase RsbU (regulator of sigma subunit)